MPKPKKKLRVAGDARMRVKTSKVLSDAIERGVRYAYNRFFKHRDDGPPKYAEEHVEAISEGAMSEVYEWFDFDDEVKE